MSYRLESDEELPAGIRRIAYEQVDQALAQLREPGDDPDEAIHDARKRFKKVRAVLRLVRDEVGEDFYQRENVCYRDAGRCLSDLRDSFVHVKTVNLLRDWFDDQLYADTFARAHDQLLAEHEALRRRMLEEERVLEQVVAKIEAARARIAEWPVERRNFSAVADGLKRVYKRGRNRYGEAYADPHPEIFHEWRKRVKYLWYHTRILKPCWPELFDTLADEIHRISNYLGDAHDLVELRATVQGRDELFASQKEKDAFFALMDRQQKKLETAARPLGERVYAEKPKQFVRRVGVYWTTIPVIHLQQ